MATEIVTPLGEITIEIDGSPAPFELTKLYPEEHICPDVAGRFMIEVDRLPDGKEHKISCVLRPSQPIKAFSESGERLECQGFYSIDEKTKVSVGIEADTNYYLGDDGKPHRGRCEFDYDGLFEERDNIFQISYCILEFTKTSHFVFGVCWIFECDSSEKDTQTWFGADPTMMGKSKHI